MAKKQEQMKTYHVCRKGGRDQRITVPASWKVTFGPLNPGSRGHEAGQPALRFYESQNQQRAVITDVISFRDTSIKVEEKRTNVKQQVLRKQTPHGDKNVVVEGRVEEWVNPDAPESSAGDSEFFRLEHKAEDNEDFGA